MVQKLSVGVVVDPAELLHVSGWCKASMNCLTVTYRGNLYFRQREGMLLNVLTRKLFNSAIIFLLFLVCLVGSILFLASGVSWFIHYLKTKISA